MSPAPLLPPDRLQHMLHNWHSAALHCHSQHTGRKHSHWDKNTQWVWLLPHLHHYGRQVCIKHANENSIETHTHTLLTPDRFWAVRQHGRQQTVHWGRTVLHTDSHCCSYWAETESSPKSQTLNLDQSPPHVWTQMDSQGKQSLVNISVLNFKFILSKRTLRKLGRFSNWTQVNESSHPTCGHEQTKDDHNCKVYPPVGHWPSSFLQTCSDPWPQCHLASCTRFWWCHRSFHIILLPSSCRCWAG